MSLVGYIHNILIAFDQFWNAAFGGDPDETISSRAGKARHRNWAADTLCKFLDRVEDDHCEHAIEWDEGGNNG